ncbi:hypothetical protein CC117_12625 [Parafrankia colletiae]|uniref:DUF6924 domain-containing protein n=1 Tax=Parafrankia colletiae TaxID=573497 RepID=A0A1S1R612_9ACTN|nr:hypothetical protein CC117_12625 [Parafrankia colletiae]
MPVSTLPQTLNSLVLRTDFSDDAAWHAVCAASSAPSPEGFAAGLSFVSELRFAGLTIEEVMALAGSPRRSFVFVVDGVTVRDSEMPILVIDLLREPGRWFRVVPARMWSVENNLSLANMDFANFADNVDPDGTFRGFG